MRRNTGKTTRIGKRDKNEMAKLTEDYQEFLLASLQDPRDAVEYLNAALAENDPRLFLLALRNVAEARGMRALATQTRLNRENLYRMLSAQGNPQLSSLSALLDAMNLRLAIQLKPADRRRKPALNRRKSG